MLNEQAFDEAVGMGLVPADFSLDSHRRLFTRMLDLAATNMHLDTVTLVETLARTKELESLGGAAYVSGLMDGVPDRPSIKAYVRLVQDASQRRSLIHACNAAIAQASDGSSKAA